MIRRLVLALALLLLLLAGALVAVLLLIDPNDYKDEIAALAREHTGRELRIVDDLSLSVFPWLGVETGRIVLANAEGFGPEPFARLDRARIKVRLIPLFSRRIEVDTVTVEGLELRLEIGEDGRSNWDDLAGRSAEADGEAKPADPGEVAVALPAALSIGGLELRNASVHYRDRTDGSEIELSRIALDNGRIEHERPVDVKLGFDLRSAAPALEGRIDFSTRLVALFTEQRFQAEALRLQARLSGEAIPGGGTSAAFQGDVTADLNADTVRIPAFTAGAFGLQASGELAVAGVSAEPRVSARVSVAEFSPRRLLEALGNEAPETTDPRALSAAALSLRLEAGADEARIAGLDARLDDTRLRGEVTVRSFEQPVIAFDLAVDALDLDRYLPPGEEPPPGSVAAAPAAALELPLETLRELDVEGNLAVDRLTATGLTMSEVKTRVRAKDGVIRLAPMTAALYGGRYTGDLTLDARGDVPRIALETSLSTVQAEPLLKDLLELDMLSGTANLDLGLTTRGEAEADLRRNLNGKASFAFRDGAIKGFNAAQLIREAKARLQGRTDAATTVRETDFTELGGTFTVTDGVLRNDDLRGSSPYLRISGAGQADIAEETIDYRLRARIVDTSAGQGGAGLDEVKGLDIPVHVRGAWADPSIGLDSDFVTGLLRERLMKELGVRPDEIQRRADELSQELKQQAEQKERDARQQLEDKAREAQERLQEKAAEKLRGLFR